MASFHVVALADVSPAANARTDLIGFVTFVEAFKRETTPLWRSIVLDFFTY